MFIVCASLTVALGFVVYFLRRRFIANIALALLTLTLCLTLLEGYFRFFYNKSDGFGRISRNFAARYYRLDDYGLRASHLPLSKQKKNIVVLGDSFVFGAGLKSPSERFSEQLATQYPQYHVVNIGLPGWDTRTETDQVSKYLSEGNAGVSLVILAYFFNDVEEDVSGADRARLLPAVAAPKETALDRWLQWLSDYSRFVEFVYFRVGYPRLVGDRLAQIEMFYGDPEIMQRHVASLERLRSLVAERSNAPLLVLILPFLHSEEWLNKTSLYGNFEHALDEHAFAHIDMQPVFVKYGIERLRVNRFDSDTNTFANELMAAAIINYLKLHPNALQGEVRTQPP